MHKVMGIMICGTSLLVTQKKSYEHFGDAVMLHHGETEIYAADVNRRKLQ